MDLGLITKYKKERDEAVRSLDVIKFNNFCKRWGSDVCPNDRVTEIAMRKMLYHLKSATEAEKKQAKEWLESRGYTTDVYGIGD